MPLLRCCRQLAVGARTQSHSASTSLDHCKFFASLYHFIILSFYHFTILSFRREVLSHFDITEVHILTRPKCSRRYNNIGQLENNYITTSTAWPDQSCQLTLTDNALVFGMQGPVTTIVRYDQVSLDFISFSTSLSDLGRISHGAADERC